VVWLWLWLQLGPTHPTTQQALERLGQLLVRQGVDQLGDGERSQFRRAWEEAVSAHPTAGALSLLADFADDTDERLRLCDRALAQLALERANLLIKKAMYLPIESTEGLMHVPVIEAAAAAAAIVLRRRLDLLNEALELVRGLPTADAAATVTRCQEARAATLVQLGRVDEAETTLTELVESGRRELGSGAPAVVDTLLMLGEALLLGGPTHRLRAKGVVREAIHAEQARFSIRQEALKRGFALLECLACRCLGDVGMLKWIEDPTVLANDEVRALASEPPVFLLETGCVTSSPSLRYRCLL
jgi:hypothetical protein